MPRKKDRVSIPEELAAKVLFVSDRICCVCRTKGKPVQIHHINEDPSDDSFENLAVLCFDCHTETQISGGFHRKLNAEQVILYRNDWIVQVAHLRTNYRELAKAEAEDVFFDFEIVTQLAEIYRERKAFDLLAIHYDTTGNKELRDKYIDLAINNGLDDDGVIHFRMMQGKGQLIPQEVIDRRVKPRLLQQINKRIRENREKQAILSGTEGIAFRKEQPNDATGRTTQDRRALYGLL